VPALIDLNLSKNRIGDQGAIRLANAIIHHNSKFQRFMIQSNELITDASVWTLVNMLENRLRLVQFWVNDCGISDLGRARMQRFAQLREEFHLNE
jgi:hypothetical protein